jgi:hypothetical protein
MLKATVTLRPTHPLAAVELAEASQQVRTLTRRLAEAEPAEAETSNLSLAADE